METDNEALFEDPLINAVWCSIDEIRLLKKGGKKNIKVGGKRSCIAEKAVHEIVRDSLEKAYGKKEFYLQTEGFPDYGNKDAEDKFLLDPLDGTCYYARQKCNRLADVTIALSRRDGEKYKDIMFGVIGDIYTEEIWSASNLLSRLKAKGWTALDKYNERKEYFQIDGTNEEHDPVILFDFYFTENAEARLKMKNPKNPEWTRFESLNLGSVAQMLVKVATGEADAFVNLGGPTSYEMAAGYS